VLKKIAGGKRKALFRGESGTAGANRKKKKPHGDIRASLALMNNGEDNTTGGVWGVAAKKPLLVKKKRGEEGKKK